VLRPERRWPVLSRVRELHLEHRQGQGFARTPLGAARGAGTAGTAGLIRILRANLLDELQKPYVVAARARGVPERHLLLRYPLRVALNPFISTVGWVLPTLVSGEVIVAQVLSLPTTGPLLLSALTSQDMYLAGGRSEERRVGKEGRIM